MPTTTSVTGAVAIATMTIVPNGGPTAMVTIMATMVVVSMAESTGGGITMASDLKRFTDPSAWRTFEDPTPPPPSAGKMLGAIAVAIGIGVFGAYMFDLHSHTCEACGNRWRHLGALNLGDPVAHTCRECGTVQWWKDGVPHVFREALRQPPPKVLPDTLVSRLREIRASPRMALAAKPRVSWPGGGSQ